MSGELAGRAAIITGASRGLGRAIAAAYVREGASVFLCARDESMLQGAREEIAALAGPGQRVLAAAADVSVPSEAERLVAEAREAFPELQVLVNNAGVYGPLGPIEEVDWGDWVRAIEINLLAPVLLCRAVLPHFRSRRYGKIIQLSGGGATNPLPRISAYAASKAAVVRFAETLAAEVRGEGIDVNSLAPGALNTRLLDQVLAAGPRQVGEGFYSRSLEQQAAGGTPLEVPARAAVFLASARSDGISGRLISAVWDPWETLPDRRDELAKTDVYTLRRIVPEDRGLEWGERNR